MCRRKKKKHVMTLARLGFDLIIQSNRLPSCLLSSSFHSTSGRSRQEYARTGTRQIKSDAESCVDKRAGVGRMRVKPMGSSSAAAVYNGHASYFSFSF